MTYYSVIGGWILKYIAAYLVSDGTAAAQDGYFTSFITSSVSPIVFMLVFLAFTAWVVYQGVDCLLYTSHDDLPLPPAFSDGPLKVF